MASIKLVLADVGGRLVIRERDRTLHSWPNLTARTDFRLFIF
jgi:hypothetical protein